MKRRINLLWLALLWAACQKHLPAADVSPLPNNLMSVLRDSLAPSELARLDTTTAFETVTGSGRVVYWRLPFRGVPMSRSFVLVAMDDRGRLLSGRLVDLVGLSGPDSLLTGTVRLRQLGGRLVVESEIKAGYVVAWRGRETAVKGVDAAGQPRTWSLPDPNTLPEVVVIGYTHDDDGDGGPSISLGDLAGMPGVGYGGGGSGGGGGGVAGPGSGGGGGSGSDGGSYVPVLPPGAVGRGAVNTPGVQPEAEYTDQLPVVDLRSMFNCFDRISSDNATYTVQLCTDVPVNSDPTAPVGFSNGISVGHTFLVATKSNSTESVTQSFGFYPGQMPPFYDPSSPVPSAIKDNGGHEWNARITITVTSAQFTQFRQACLSNAGNNYQLVLYNCTNFGLNGFNTVEDPPIKVDPLNIVMPSVLPGTGIPLVSVPASPQMLYASLVAMKNAGGPMAATIETDLSGRAMAPVSHGQCP
jgi:hypothetical protein